MITPLRRVLLVLLVCLFITSLAAQQPPPTPEFFPVSVWYAGGKARAPMLEPVTPESRAAWKQDLLKIKSLGFNTVRTWLEWSVAEPRQGEYHFEQFEMLLGLADEVGLRVIAQVYADSAPDWVGEKFPDGRFVDQNGNVVISQAAPGYCFDHGGVRRAVLNFYQAAARAAAKSPAFYGWDLWSEPHVINWAIIPNAEFCFCPSSLARFREWLKLKYKTLDALNTAWHRGFRTWDEVQPPRFGTILTYSDYMDWKVFTSEKLGEDLKFRHDAVKEILPRGITSSHSAVPSVFTGLSSGDGTPDDWLMSRSADYYGLSFYPKHSFPNTHWSLARRALAMDFARSSSGGEKGFVVGELQAGFGARGVVLGSEVTPQDHEIWTWSMVARGAKWINFYAFYPMSSGYESGGYGLINLDGTLTERSKHAGAMAKKISDNSDLILKAQPVAAEAAILFNHMSTLMGGEQNSGSRATLRDATAGWHRMFYERNIPVEFLSARDVTAADLAKYKLVVVPYPIVLTQRVAELLEEYVRKGGRLITEARAGWVDERGYAQPVIPGFGWHRMFGVREKSVTPRTEFRIRWGDSGAFKAVTFEERFEIVDPSARAIATFEDGSAAAYERQHGKGKAIVVGAFVGQVNETSPQEGHPLGAFLAQWAGLSAPDLKAPAQIEVRQMTATAGRLVFFFNHTDKAAPVEFSTALDKAARKITELLTGESITPLGANFKLNATLPPQSARVYRVDY